MAKFGIYSASGVLKGVGCPTFTGTYMKPGVLEFREIASPNPIDWAIGDYVGYEENNTVVPAYPRTGWKYSLYNIPQVKRQARNRTYGASFVYQNVQFYDASFLLSIIPFRDLVPGDNRVHFSTQPTIAVFTNVAGIAERIQACLDVDYSTQWNIRLATTAMGATQEVVDLMNEYRNFSVSGVTLMGVLDKVYEVWPEIGWVFSVENGVNTITFGGAGLNLSSAQTYLYGKGNGLTSLTRTPANTDELANRIYAYGSSRNMMSGWYRSQPIKEADSVDIEHLMLPIYAVSNNPSDPNYYPGLTQPYPGWGLSDDHGTDKPDAAKAFVEDSASISARGLREKIVYFDGKQDTEEIYPTIRNMTIADVIAAVPSGNTYSPNTSIYTDTSVRVDMVRSVVSTFDSGLSAELGKQTILSEYNTLSRTSPIEVYAGAALRQLAIMTKTITIPETGKLNLDVSFDLNGDIAASDATVSAWIEVKYGTERIGKTDIEITHSGSQWIFGDVNYIKNGIQATSGDTITLEVWAQIRPNATSSSDRQYVTAVSAVVSSNLSRYREKTFQITIRQVGFDISEQATLGNGKTIHFRTGKCAGRTFTIQSCTYQRDTDSWLLDIIRSEDESLSQWFPNSDYPVRGLENVGQSNEYPGDEFVLLDIAMPDSYVIVAEKKLLVAAQEYLDWSKKEIWQYTPDIDAKFMVENYRTILPAQYIILYDANLITADELAGRFYFKDHNEVYYLTKDGEKILLSTGDESAAVLVDSVVINDGESTIPTYKVTLRERKRKKVSSSAEVSAPSSNPVTTTTKTPTETKVTNDYWEEDEDGNVKLKDEYGGVWAKGFISAGGIGSGGSGGGVDLDRVWQSLTNNTDKPNVTINPAHIPIASTSAIGGVRVDGATITINSSGVISAIGGGTITSVVKGTAVAGGDVTTSEGVVTIQFPTIPTNISSFTNDSGYITGITSTMITTALGYTPASSSALSDYLPLAGGNMSGDITFNHNLAVKFKDSGGTARNGLSLSSNVLYLGGSSKETQIYGTNLGLYYGSLGGPALTILDSGRTKIHQGLEFSRTDSGTISDAYIDYDSTNHAIHVHGSIYADGFVTAGGIGGANSTLVTIDGTQTITGTKTFSAATTFSTSLTSGKIFVGQNGTGSSATQDIRATNDRLYIQRSVSQDLVLCTGDYSHVVAGIYPSSSLLSDCKLYVNGNAKADAWNSVSDVRLKDKIQPITDEDAIVILMALNPVTWIWSGTSNEGKKASGLIAQEVEPVIPFMVQGEDYKSLTYSMFHAYEIKGIQNHEKRIKALEDELIKMTSHASK